MWSTSDLGAEKGLEVVQGASATEGTTGGRLWMPIFEAGSSASGADIRGPKVLVRLGAAEDVLIDARSGVPVDDDAARTSGVSGGLKEMSPPRGSSGRPAQMLQ